LGTIFGEEKVKLETKPSTFLGMAIEYHKDKDISLNQNGYIQAITISLGTYCPPVLVKATKQGAITRSSCESEYNTGKLK
jgi:hypothetical protein